MGSIDGKPSVRHSSSPIRLVWAPLHQHGTGEIRTDVFGGAKRY